MKIEYRKGNLFETDILHIAHGCNAQGVMGSGVAKIVKEQYFDAYRFYAEQYDEHGLKLGDVQFIPSNGKVIVNARTINTVLKQSGETHVALPQIGAGLGGGDWTVIAAIVESEMTDIHPVVYVL